MIESINNEAYCFAVEYKYFPKKLICFISMEVNELKFRINPYEAFWTDLHGNLYSHEIQLPGIFSTLFEY